ncbi:sodium/calcium exchanger MaX1 [archaeon MnTg01]|nr:sodium/calcium exchanger MaX1 [archaeon MnTg01]
MEIAVNAGLTVLGIVMLCFGGHYLVEGGVAIARRFRISSFIIGMTVVAYGTSTPELAASIAAAGQHTQLILGNVVGSNISNIGMVIGISAILVPLVVQKTTVRKEVPIMIGVSLLLIVLSLDNGISQWEGGLLIAGLIAFTLYIYKSAKKQRDNSNFENTEEPTRKSNFGRSIGLLALGVGLLWAGAILTIDNVIVIAESYGITERIIGLTIIAIGTSLPELITSIIAIKKGHHDIGIGTIIGSNIYNVLMIIGVAGAIGGIVVVSEVFIDYAVMIGFSVVLLIVMKTGMITRPMGIGLVVAFAAYLGWLLLFP